MELYYHPLSRYSQKVLIALYEKQASFKLQRVDLSEPFSRKSFSRLYPPGKLPLLKTNDGLFLPESSIIIEYVETQIHSGTQLLPQAPMLALEVRLYDRLCENLSFELDKLEQETHTNQNINHIKIKKIQNNINEMLNAFDDRLSQNYWLCDDNMTLADCSLIPCLIAAKAHFQLLDFEHLGRYWMQAQVRGSVIKVTEEVEQMQVTQ